jgi:hypothetical protein
MNFLQPGNPVRIKICGITSPADAEMAVAAGADALGFNFFPGSKRGIVFKENRQWIDSLSGRVFRVAVVVNAKMEELRALRESGCFEAVQFHGNETPEFRSGFALFAPKGKSRSERPFDMTPGICCSMPGQSPPTAARVSVSIGTLCVNSLRPSRQSG